MSPKPTQRYLQRFRKEWLQLPEFQHWIAEKHGDSYKAQCKWCKVEIKAKLYYLHAHAKTKKHTSIKNELASGRQPTLVFHPHTTTNSAAAEARLSLHVAAHSSIITIDHLSEVCKHSFEDSKVASALQLHRTKCSEIIKTVWYDHFQKELLADIANGKYSLLLDESNDISVTKMLGIVIIYFSSKLQKIISTFFDLIPLHECNANSIVEVLSECLQKRGLDINNLMGIGTDNASVMVGINNGVYSKLKQILPNLVLIRCVCHSLQLAVSDAVGNSLPRNLEFLVKETYNWFSRSPARQENYKELYKTLNNGNNPLKITNISNTRWMSISIAVRRIIEQWTELKLHFQLTRTNEKCYMSELLHSMYNDDQNLAYFLFLDPILTNVQNVNKAFESNTSDKTKLLNDLLNLLKTLINAIVIPTARIDLLATNIEEHVDANAHLGYRFEKHMRESNITVEIKNVIRKRCTMFITKLINQIRQRLPDNIQSLKDISLLAPSETLKIIKPSLIPLLEKFVTDEKDIETIEFQWKNITNVKWANLQNPEEFWIEVKSYKAACNDNPYGELADFALNMLILPHSNAEIERLFSQMNVVKNKLRNKMKIDMLTSILTVRSGLQRVDACCSNYNIPLDIVQKIGTNQAYSFKIQDALSTLNDDVELDDIF